MARTSATCGPPKWSGTSPAERSRFAWLSTQSPKTSKGKTIVAEVDGQTIRITKDPLIPYVAAFGCLVDLDEPIEIVVNGTPFLQGQVHRTEAAIRQSLSERFDPASVATALWISPLSGILPTPVYGQLPRIIYTITDEAPALATVSFLPILRRFAAAAGVDVETRDISLAAASCASSRNA